MDSGETVNQVVAGPARWTRSGERATFAFGVTIAERVQEIWYRLPDLPGLPDLPVSTAGDAQVAACLLPAMAAGTTLSVPHAISPRLADALPAIQAIYHAWNAGGPPVRVATGPPGPAAPPGEGVGCFFSGGLDSFYTALKRRAEITHLVFVHGFDLRLEDRPLRRRVSAALREAARGLGKPLIEVETNLRELSDRLVSWDFYHGAALASVAHLLAPVLGRLYVAASDSYAFLPPWGSHPLLDPLWSTEQIEIVHDGCEATRPDKARVVAQSDIALTTLRVCYENPGGAYNCGRCRKCLRTMVALRIAGALSRCTTFDRPLDLRAVARLRRDPVYVRRDLEAVRQRGGDPALERALDACLRRSDRKDGWLRGLAAGGKRYAGRVWGVSRRRREGNRRLSDAPSP